MPALISTRSGKLSLASGVTPSTLLRSQPCRMPGCIREETGKWQKLIYLDTPKLTAHRAEQEARAKAARESTDESPAMTEYYAYRKARDKASQKSSKEETAMSKREDRNKYREKLCRIYYDKKSHCFWGPNSRGTTHHSPMSRRSCDCALPVSPRMRREGNE